MKTLSQGTKGTVVKIYQGLLKLHGYDPKGIDGSFGPGCHNATVQFQKDHGLNPNGHVDSKTWEAIGVPWTSSTDILCIKIPLKVLTAQQVLLKNKQKYSVQKFSAEYPQYNFIFNAGMFNMSDRFIISDTVIDGKVINGGNYSNIGFAFCNDRSVGSIYPSTTQNSTNKNVDFVGGSPALIPVRDNKGLNSAYLNQSTIWTMIGLDDQNFYYMTNLATMKMSKMISEAQRLKIKHLINLDGGGSRSMAMCGTGILTTSRAIPEVIALKIQNWK